MILADIPAIPLPEFITRTLANWGFIVPRQADRALQPEPERYGLEASLDADWEWHDILTKEEEDLKAVVPQREVLGLSPDSIRRAVLRCYNARFQTAFRFFRMTQRLHPGRFRWALAAPRRLRAKFQEQGLVVDRLISSLLWMVSKAALVVHAGVGLLRNFFAALADGLGRNGKRGEGRPVVWWGLSPAELRSGSGELNALDFAREGRLELFRERPPLYVSAPWRKEIEAVPDIGAVHCPDPMRATPGQRLSVRGVVQLIRDTFAVGTRILLDCFREDGLFLLLAREYVVLPRARLWFQNVEPKAIVVTNAVFTSHPLWLAYAKSHGCETVMLFYSTNCVAFYWVGLREPVPGDDAYRFLECSRFEVWTEGHKRYLVSLGVPEEKIHVAGIIVWGRYGALERPRQAESLPPDRPLRVGVFDVIPMSHTFWLRLGFGERDFTVEHASRLLLDVVELSRGLPGRAVNVFLKSKRPRFALHNERYTGLVDQLIEEGRLSIFPATLNPIDAVAACDVVISTPFSSPSVIASSMNIPCCFYQPSQVFRLAPILISPEIPLISGPDQLRSWLLRQAAAVGGGVVARDAQSEQPQIAGSGTP